MNNAKCTQDGVIYSALEFNRLFSDDLERKRRFLQCPVCGGTAFFRHASPIGRAACFGARPHAQGCQLGAQEIADDDQEAMLFYGSTIVVDCSYGSAARSERFFGSEPVPMQEDTGSRYDQPYGHIYHRRLGPLLQNLIEYPAFGNSDLVIDVKGHDKIFARNFFIPLASATCHYSGHFRGYWGVLSDAKWAADKSLWFNSGGNDNISFCLDSKFVDIVFQRYGINDLEEIAGAYILVLGTPRVSLNGKLFCLIDGVEQMALKLT